MAHPIPEPYVWDVSFQTFYDVIDDQHKELFENIFKLAKDPSSTGALFNMRMSLQIHFLDEQVIMDTAGYGSAGYHGSLHDDFLEKIGAFSVPVNEAQINFVKSWLVNHIKTEDFKYKGELDEAHAAYKHDESPNVD